MTRSGSSNSPYLLKNEGMDLSFLLTLATHSDVELAYLTTP
ncbi:hypothetical protein [Spirosoma arboris]|nr:hypothetical protein [Spirosoma arboris]